MSKHRPYAVKIELARGCTQRCAFCSLPNMAWADGPWQFMTETLFQQLVDAFADWLPQGVRFEFEGRGEPSFHPKLREFIRYARQRYPRVQMLLTTNGDMVNHKKERYREWLLDLFEQGLNIAMLDCYTIMRYADFCERFPEAVRFFEDRVHPYRYSGPKHTQIILMDAAPGRESVIRQYHNQGGTVDVERACLEGFEIDSDVPVTKMCVRPFREFVVWSDGVLPICCNDWLPANVIGVFPQTSLQTYWEKGLNPARRLLLQKDRAALKPCDVCTERSGFRWALEKDWFGDVKN